MAVFPAGEGSAVRFKGMRGACRSCHRDVHDGELGERCESCHGTTTFTIHEYVHREGGEFFAGDHEPVPCRECHRSIDDFDPVVPDGILSLNSLDRNCATCHDDVHTGTLGLDCASCHTVYAPFRNADRAFHKDTLLPLEGRHLAVPCAECHMNGQIKGTPTRCYDCHWIRRQDDPFRTTLGAECEACHRPVSWTAVRWDHGAVTGYPLGGAHFGVGCENCHGRPPFDSHTPKDCVSCHLTEYREADEPDHVASGFPTDCEICHRASSPSWDDAVFNHTTFRLLGAHRRADCASCHSGGVYGGLPSDCVDCHIEDYRRTEEPDHETAGFPTDCEICHSPSRQSWEDTPFAHSTYPLVGAHTALDCASCHASGVYQGLPSQCVDCHLPDFQQTTDPNHQAAGFPTDCEICHRASDVSWTQGVFDHVWFPIDTGAHKVFECSECHLSQGNFAAFSCTTSCHPKSQMDQKHREESGYAYNSAACFSCHPDGRSIFGPGPVSSHE